MPAPLKAPGRSTAFPNRCTRPHSQGNLFEQDRIAFRQSRIAERLQDIRAHIRRHAPQGVRERLVGKKRKRNHERQKCDGRPGPAQYAFPPDEQNKPEQCGQKGKRVERFDIAGDGGDGKRIPPTRSGRPQKLGCQVTLASKSRRLQSTTSAKMGTRKPCEYCGSVAQRSAIAAKVVAYEQRNAANSNPAPAKPTGQWVGAF